MSISTTKTYTATGTQTAIDVGVTNQITYAVKEDVSGLTFDVEVQITNGGDWFKVSDSTQSTGQAYTFLGGVTSVRLNITSLGSSTSVNFEVGGT